VDLESRDAGLRIVDINKCLAEVTVGYPHYYFPNADEIGGAVRLAQSIKGTESSSIGQFEAVGNRLGLRPADVRNTILPILSQLGWIDTRKDGSGKIVRVDENIPIVGDVFKEAGELFFEREPSDAERAGVSVLSLVSRCPSPFDDLASRIDVRTPDLQLALEQAKAGQFLGEYEYAHNRIVYTPYLWDTPSTDVLKTIASLPRSDYADILAAAKVISRYPGIPLETLKMTLGANADRVMAEATRCGLFGRATIETLRSGTHEFVFIPSKKLRVPSEGSLRNDVFDRVRAVISCVRQGQHFASRTRIRDPVVLLQALLDNGYIGKTPHKDIKDQYTILEPWFGTAARAYDDRYTFQFNRTQENEEIARLAIDVLREPEAATAALLPEEVNELIGVGGRFHGPEVARIRKAPGGPVPLGYAKLMETIRGERHDEF